MRQFRIPKIIKPGSKVDLFLTKRYSSELFSYGQIFAMLVPLIIDQFFIFSISMFTSAMISSSSQESVTAVGLVGPLTMLVSSIFSAIGAGGTVIVAQAVGKGDQNMIERSAAQVVLMSFLVATFLSITLFILAPQTVGMLFSTAEPIVLEKAATYVRGVCISNLPFAIYNGVFSVLRGVGDTKRCLRLTLIINFIYLFASMIFINVLKMDIVGTSIALILARLIGCGFSIYILLRSGQKVSISFKSLLRLDPKTDKSIVKLGIPFAAEQIFLNVGALVAQIYIVLLGTVSVAANVIAGSVVNMFYGVGFAATTLTITVVGQCIGAGQKEQARIYGKRMVELGAILMTVGIFVIAPFLPLILKMYSPEPSTLAIIKNLIVIAIIPMPFFWSLSNVTPSTLRAAGDATFTSMVSLVCMWLFRVGLGYVFAIPLKMGIYGVWYCIGIEWAARSLVFWLRSRGNKWLEKRVL